MSHAHKMNNLLAMRLMSAFKHKLFNRITLGLCMLLMYAAVLFFAWYTGASSTIRQDQWHHLTMLAQYFDTGFSADLLMLRHDAHLQLVYNAWYFLNGVLFGLNTRLELFIGLLFLGGFLLVLHKEFSASIEHLASPLQRQMMFVLMLMVALSFHQYKSYTYSLLSFVAFAGALLMILYVSLLSRFMTERNSSLTAIALMMSIFLLLGGGIAGGGWVIYLGVTIMTAISWLVTHRPPKKQVAMLSAGLSTVVPLLLWMNSSGGGVPIDTGNGAEFVLQNLDQAGVFMLLLFANSVIDINTFVRLGLLHWAYVAGVVLAVAHIAGIYLFYRTRMWEKTYIPFFLMMIFWVFALALLLYRFPGLGAVKVAAAPRYVTTLQIGLLGVLWVLIYWINTLPRRGAKIMWPIVGLAVAVPYFVHMWGMINFSSVMRDYEKKAAEIIIQEKFEKKTQICPDLPYCPEGVQTLKKHKLNLYKDS